jgi:hypothetical protein
MKKNGVILDRKYLPTQKSNNLPFVLVLSCYWPGMLSIKGFSHCKIDSTF